MKNKPGLGELLRYVAELVDSGSAATYRDMTLDYRPRYTPILRAMVSGACTVTEITGQTSLTQGAVSQSVSMMEQDGILIKSPLQDGRKSSLRLTEKGQQLITVLQSHWETLFTAIDQLEKEIGYPLISVLQKTAGALERQGFDERIRLAANSQKGEQNG